MTLVSAYAIDLLEPPRPDPIEWARQLDLPARESASSPGRYCPEPYQGEIIRANTDPDVRSVTACIGTQGGKSLSFAISLLYLLDNDPGNVLIGTATQDMAKSLGRERLQPIIDSNPILARHKPADVDLYKVQEMSFDRATWVITGTQSSNGVISRPCRITWIDEAQRAGTGIIAEAEQRTKRYPHTHKHLRSGTPTTPENDLWQLYLKGTREHWHHPCPHCGVEFALENYYDERATANHRPEVGLTWSAEAKVDGQWIEELVRQSACYICPHCKTAIHEDDRLPMVRSGHFVVTNPAADSSNRSFWVPSLCTREVTFAEMAVQFLRALTDFFGFREFLNGYWALPFSAAAATVSDAAVDAARGTHRTGEIPFVPVALTFAGDLGDEMTHWEIAAHGPEGELAVVDYGTVLAPEDVLPLLDRTYPDPSGKHHRIIFGLLDSGHQAHRVYRICIRSQGRLFPSKGSGAETGRSTWSQNPVADYPGLYLVSYIDHLAKIELYLNRISKRLPPGVTFPIDSTPAFLHGHCGQRLKSEKTVRGYRQFFPPVAHDHYGDCTKENLVAGSIIRSRMQG